VTPQAAAGAPARSPVACGALGRYRREVVEDIGRRLGVPMREAHRDRGSILLLDRAPIRWGRWRRRGLAWSELPDAGRPERPSSWQAAAGALRACGLELDGPRRFVHSSVTGIAPLYYVDREGATYFASRIDPLVAGVGGSFTVDWEAWASILWLTHPVGDQTPFAEVRRLRPLERLRRDGERSRVERPPWPWQRTESTLTVAEGVEPMLAALRAAVRPLAAVPAVSLLSGGLDSRLLLALAVEAGASDVRALTLGSEEAQPIQQRLAAEVAGYFGVPHEVRDYRDPEHYLEVWSEHALAVDFQRVRAPWIAVLGERLGEHRRLALDGLGLDALATHSSAESPRFYRREMFEPRRPAELARMLWRETMRMATRGSPTELLSPQVARALARSSRRSFVAEARAFAGHPSQPLLVRYATRTVRGVSSLPDQVLGAHAAVATPFVDDAVVRACLEIDPRDKLGFRLYDALFAAVDPGARRVASTVDPDAGRAPGASSRAMRRSPAVAARFERLLAGGPLAPHYGEELRRLLAGGGLAEGLGRTPRLYRGVLALALLGEWRERYSSLLGDVDAGEVLACEPPFRPLPSG